VGERRGLYGTCGYLAPSPFRAIRLRQYTDDGMAGSDQSLESRDREIRRSGEGDT
jgi:hypothetical protein